MSFFFIDVNSFVPNDIDTINIYYLYFFYYILLYTIIIIYHIIRTKGLKTEIKLNVGVRETIVLTDLHALLFKV